MADAPARDRLYPSLLDRLTDEDPSRQVEAREGRATSMGRLRESVLRDLNWLFNATQVSADLDDYPEVKASVVNYGLPALSGRTASGVSLGDLTREVRDMLLRFEPRLIPDTVRVLADSTDEMSHNVLTFRIEAQLWSQPIPLEIYMRTEVDLESGQTRVTESKPG